MMASASRDVVIVKIREIRLVTRHQALAVVSLIVICTAPEVPADGPVAMAIMEFHDSSTETTTIGLARALQEMLSTDLAHIGSFQLVERARLAEVLSELDLVRRGIVDEATAARVGKAIGARVILVGNLHVTGKTLRLDARLIHVASATVLVAEKAEGVLDDFFHLQKKLAHQIIEATGTTASKLELAELEQRHTSSFDAVLALGRALRSEDDGVLEQASREAQQAQKLDAEFALATKMLARVNEILAAANDRAFVQVVDRIVDFEYQLPEQNLWGMNSKMLGYFEPCVFAKIYEASDAGALRALNYWAMRAARRGGSGTTDDLFMYAINLIGQEGFCDVYAKVGGYESALFWGDVFTADNAMLPTSARDYQEASGRAMDLRLTGTEAYRCYYAMDRFPAVIQSRAWSFARRGKYEDALITLEQGIKLYQNTPLESVFVDLLARTKQRISTPARYNEIRNFIRQEMRYWKIAQREIEIGLARRQCLEFGPVEAIRETPAGETPRERYEHRGGKQLTAEYAQEIQPSVMFEGDEVRAAEKLVASLLGEAKGAAFVARKDVCFPHLYETGKFEVVTTFHIGGCPWSAPSGQAQLLWPPRRSSNNPHPLALSPISGVDQCTDAASVPCKHCRPTRWMQAWPLAARLTSVAASLDGGWTVVRLEEAIALLACEAAAPCGEADLAVRRLVRLACLPPWEPTAAAGEAPREAIDKQNWYVLRREFAKAALMAIAKRITVEDLGLLREIGSSPFFEHRAWAAAAGGALRDDRVSVWLKEREAGEAYPFVRNWIAAARHRQTHE